MDSEMGTDTGAKQRQALSPRDPRLAAWRGLLTAHALVVDRLDQELRAEAGMSLADYSALLQLAEAPERRLRMSQLAEGIFLTRSGVTRLVDRLQAEGLVDRSQCSSDGRGAEAILTEVGLSTLRAASRIHLRGVKAYFIDQVTDVELEVLERSMGAVSVGITSGCGPETASD